MDNLAKIRQFIIAFPKKDPAMSNLIAFIAVVIFLFALYAINVNEGDPWQ